MGGEKWAEVKGWGGVRGEVGVQPSGGEDGADTDGKVANYRTSPKGVLVVS